MAVRMQSAPEEKQECEIRRDLSVESLLLLSLRGGYTASRVGLQMHASQGRLTGSRGFLSRIARRRLSATADDATTAA